MLHFERVSVNKAWICQPTFSLTNIQSVDSVNESWNSVTEYWLWLSSKSKNLESSKTNFSHPLPSYHHLQIASILERLISPLFPLPKPRPHSPTESRVQPPLPPKTSGRWIVGTFFPTVFHSGKKRRPIGSRNPSSFLLVVRQSKCYSCATDKWAANPLAIHNNRLLAHVAFEPSSGAIGAQRVVLRRGTEVRNKRTAESKFWTWQDACDSLSRQRSPPSNHLFLQTKSVLIYPVVGRLK